MRWLRRRLRGEDGVAMVLVVFGVALLATLSVVLDRHRHERVRAKREGRHAAVVVRGRRGGARRLHREARRRPCLLPALGPPGRVDPPGRRQRRHERARLGERVLPGSEHLVPRPEGEAGACRLDPRRDVAQQRRTARTTGAASATATSTTSRSQPPSAAQTGVTSPPRGARSATRPIRASSRPSSGSRRSRTSSGSSTATSAGVPARRRTGRSTRTATSITTGRRVATIYATGVGFAPAPVGDSRTGDGLRRQRLDASYPNLFGRRAAASRARSTSTRSSPPSATSARRPRPGYLAVVDHRDRGRHDLCDLEQVVALADLQQQRDGLGEGLHRLAASRRPIRPRPARRSPGSPYAVPTNGAIYSEVSVIVQGTVKGRVTVATEDEILIANTLLYDGDGGSFATPRSASTSSGWRRRTTSSRRPGRRPTSTGAPPCSRRPEPGREPEARATTTP